MVTTAVLDNSTSPTVARRRGATRFSYSKVEERALKYVIADIYDSGEEDWTEQESGESRWYSFTPSDEERELVRRWMISSGPVKPWQLVTLGRSVPRTRAT